MYPRARNPCTKALVTGSIGSGPAITERGAVLKKYPTRYTLIACCALAASGHVVAAPPIRPRNSRRLMSAPKTQDEASYPAKLAYRKGSTDVRFGSKADICAAKSHVRFTPKSRHVQCISLCLLWAKSRHRLLAFPLLRRVNHLAEICQPFIDRGRSTLHGFLSD